MAINFLTNTLPTRLNDFVKGVIVNIQQRLHYNDVSGYIKENYPFYKQITLPVETSKNRYYVGPISGKTYMYKAGSILWPNRMPRKWLLQTKKEQGARTYTSQFLQDPTPPGGNLINPDWFREWTTLPIYNEKTMKQRSGSFKIVMGWDMNFKKKAGNDLVACSVLLTDGTSSYLVDSFNEQIGFVETLDAVTNMRKKWERRMESLQYKIPIEVVIEEAANGAAVMEVLQHTIPGMLPIQSTDDKVSRMTSVTPFIEAGNVFVPSLKRTDMAQKYAWWNDFLTELARFPYVPHDDRSDSLSIALRRIYIDKPKKKRRMMIY